MENIYHYTFSSLISPIRLGLHDSQVVSLDFVPNTAKKLKDSPLTKAELRFAKSVEKQLSEYFQKRRRVFDLEFLLYGTDFQIKSWQALTRIPYGTTVSYKDQAKSIRCPAAVRAVGSANGKNPLPILIPCHRVVGSDGGLGGYSGGLHIKRFLLDLEGVSV
jgi:methylated-DNA-[protein]-cysteine S-methyltransferase